MPFKKGELNGKPFPKGVSANPGGRPKITPTFKAFQGALQDFSQEGAEILITAIKSGLLTGSELVAALRIVFGYSWGMPTQVVDVEANVNQNSFVVHVALDQIGVQLTHQENLPIRNVIGSSDDGD